MESGNIAIETLANLLRNLRDDEYTPFELQFLLDNACEKGGVAVRCGNPVSPPRCDVSQ